MTTVMKASLLPLVSLLCACATGSDGGNTGRHAACPPNPGEWMIPASGRPVALAALLDDLANRPAVLLGESHTSAEDHHWQLHTLAALHGRTPHLVLGFEAFPRRLQPVLDRWVAGELTERAFLGQSEWNDVWGFPPALYMPLFDFARMNRIPMVALNVERKLVARVGKDGWDAIPADVREGVGTPAAASPPYVDSLARIYAQHRTPRPAAEETSKEAEPTALPTLDDADFRHFVEAQGIWDRAMAEAIAAAHRRPGQPLVVGIVGRGHVEYGFGIPHQLADLGLPTAAVLVTWPGDRDCTEFIGESQRPVATAVFGVAPEESESVPQGPRLGVQLGEAPDGVRIADVIAGSVAEAAGLMKGDIVREAAGQPVAKPGDLAATIRRQPFGTWLPLAIEREGRTVELIAKFPARPHPAMGGTNPHRHTAPATAR